MTRGDLRLSRRQMLAAAGLCVAGCGGKGGGLPLCATKAAGPGLGYCLIGLERLTVVGAASLPAGRVMIMAADDNNAAVVAHDDRGFYALSATCRHQCCTVALCDMSCGSPVVSPNECASPRSAQLPTSGPAFLCPCHGSTYAADGTVLSGPSLQSLPPVAMQIVGADVIVDLSQPASPTDRVTT